MRISDWSSDVCSSDLSAGLRTNLVITTSRRVYHLALESRPTGAMAALSWTYPRDELIALRRQQDAAAAAVPVASGLAVERLNFNYRSEEHTSELQSLMRSSYAVFCLQQKIQ